MIILVKPNSNIRPDSYQGFSPDVRLPSTFFFLLPTSAFRPRSPYFFLTFSFNSCLNSNTSSCDLKPDLGTRKNVRLSKYK